ncbi:MAG: 4-hydroxy-tetrahydrodipicolinate reductase [Gemmatimonadota bacterium]|nr:MAG: 4-hydroxy-tetrahydrodipicolinate reductase [Gemmatimonadota bacterium]
MTIRVCVAGATGWAGSALSLGIAQATDMELVAAVSRTHAGKTLGSVIHFDDLLAPVHATVAEVIAYKPDVLVEYTKPDVAKVHVVAALEGGAHVVVGTSGLTDDDYREIDEVAQSAGRGVLAAGNFAITAVLLQKFAEAAARYVPQWEIIDYADAGKEDVPSGTVRELVNRLSRVRPPHKEVAIESLQGPQESRGAELDGTQVHSVRLPGYTLSVDAIFGMPDQRLILRHEAGASAEPYVEGALLAIRKVSGLVGVHRGLATVMEM